MCARCPVRVRHPVRQSGAGAQASKTPGGEAEHCGRLGGELLRAGRTTQQAVPAPPRVRAEDTAGAACVRAPGRHSPPLSRLRGHLRAPVGTRARVLQPGVWAEEGERGGSGAGDVRAAWEQAAGLQRRVAGGPGAETVGVRPWTVSGGTCKAGCDLGEIRDPAGGREPWPQIPWVTDQGRGE